MQDMVATISKACQAEVQQEDITVKVSKFRKCNLQAVTA